MSEDVLKLVGRNVKRLRVAAGISQVELPNAWGWTAPISVASTRSARSAVVTLWHLGQALTVKLGAFFRAEKPDRRAR